MRYAAALLSVPLLAAPLAAHAQVVTGPYVSVGAGVNLLQDEIVQPSRALRSPKRRLDFDTGWTGQISFGYGFGNGLRVEIEGDYSNNHVRKISFPGAPERAGGYEEHFGGMANVLYDFDFGLPLFPYVGVGVGGQVDQHDGFNFSGPDFVFPRAPGTSSVGAFAYQAIAGISYPLPAPGLSLTAEYRFMGLLDPQPAFAFATLSPTTGAVVAHGNLKFANDLNHTFLIGVRYAFGVASPPPPPAPVAPPAPAPARTYLVFFDWDRADLTARARQIVAEAAAASTHVQTTRIECNGYTDLSGTAAYNQKLSVRRADSVAAELVKDGVPRSEISIQGFGETHPLVPTAQGVREPQNRRVEIILH